MAIALSIAIPIMAQEKKAAKGKRAQLSQVARVMLRMGKLREALAEVDLTAEQKESLDKVREELGPKMKEAFTELKEIFTEEQRTEFLREYALRSKADIPLTDISELTKILEKTILLRALSWCYMAYYEYVQKDRKLKNNDTFLKIKTYMDEIEWFLR